MTRKEYIEQIRRLIYNGFPSDDATITVNLVNTWINQAIGVAAKANYKENIALEGVGYLNNSFYSNFSNITISPSGTNLWTLTLPSIPLGVGTNEGLPILEVVDEDGSVSRGLIPLSQNQRTVYKNIRPIPNKILYYYNGNKAYLVSYLLLNKYTANITMVSGGDSSDINSTLNVPDDYIPLMTDYIIKNLLLEHGQPVDAANDGMDFAPQQPTV